MYWSWLLASVGIFGIYLTTRKLFAGFIIGILAQILWVIYAFATDQYGFLVSAAGYAAVNALGLYKWTHPETQKKE